MKYIDADRLKAEIERRRLSNRYIDTDGYESELLDIIDSLQQERPQVADASKMEQPEVDLQKEAHDYICSNEYLNTRGDGSLLIERHFYELGRNTRKDN